MAQLHMLILQGKNLKDLRTGEVPDFNKFQSSILLSKIEH